MQVKLGTVKTGAEYVKFTNIYYITLASGKAIKFYSSSDECNYIYTTLKLEDAIRQYILDTKWQRFSEIQFFSSDPEIIEEFKTNVIPWF